MRNKITPNYFPALILLATAVIACNMPAGSTPINIQPPQVLPTQNDMPPVESTQPVAASPEALVTTPAPAEAVIQTNLPTITLDGGTGYIFSTQQTTKDDRDIWWNAVQIVPNTGYRIVSLGVINSPLDVGALTFPNQSPAFLEPVIGEAFGLEINRDNAKTYAIIRVIKMDSERRVTFDWVYPFNGAVTINP